MGLEEIIQLSVMFLFLGLPFAAVHLGLSYFNYQPERPLLQSFCVYLEWLTGLIVTFLLSAHTADLTPIIVAVISFTFVNSAITVLILKFFEEEIVTAPIVQMVEKSEPNYNNRTYLMRALTANIAATLTLIAFIVVITVGSAAYYSFYPPKPEFTLYDA